MKSIHSFSLTLVSSPSRALKPAGKSEQRVWFRLLSFAKHILSKGNKFLLISKLLEIHFRSETVHEFLKIWYQHKYQRRRVSDGGRGQNLWRPFSSFSDLGWPAHRPMLQKMWIRCCEGTSITTTSLSSSAKRIKNFRTYARTREKQDKKSIKTLFHKIIEKLPLNIFSPPSTQFVVVDVSDCANENNIELDRRERSPNWFIAVASAEYQSEEALPLHTTQKVRLQQFKSVSRWFERVRKVMCLYMFGNFWEKYPKSVVFQMKPTSFSFSTKINNSSWQLKFSH